MCGAALPSAPDVGVVADFDGDADTDRSVFRSGAWYAEGQDPAYLGLPGDVPVPGDYDGDADADRAVYRDGALVQRRRRPRLRGHPGARARTWRL